MKIVVIGGSGLIGTKVVKSLREKGHDVLAASPRSGVDCVTGKGLAEALAGAEIVVDVANSPSFEDRAVLEFFVKAGRHLVAAETAAGVKRHVVLSVVGADRLPESGYLRAKVAQERLVEKSGIPYTIVRATQFFEFVGRIAQSATAGPVIRLTSAPFQPIASDGVAEAVVDAALAAPVNGVVEVAGPERIPLDILVRRWLTATGDPRRVVTDASARYFGAQLDDRSVTAGDDARIFPLRFADWLAQLVHKKAS